MSKITESEIVGDDAPKVDRKLLGILVEKRDAHFFGVDSILGL